MDKIHNVMSKIRLWKTDINGHETALETLDSDFQSQAVVVRQIFCDIKEDIKELGAESSQDALALSYSEISDKIEDLQESAEQLMDLVEPINTLLDLSSGVGSVGRTKNALEVLENMNIATLLHGSENLAELPEASSTVSVAITFGDL